MYWGERAKLRAEGEVASQLLEAICTMRRARGGCAIDVSTAAAHVSKRGLLLHVTILDHQLPQQRDGVSGDVLLAAAEVLHSPMSPSAP